MTTQNKKSRFARHACVIVLFIIIVFFISIVVRMLTRQILVEHFGMENRFTNAIFFDAQELRHAQNDNSDTLKEINWGELYPFSNSMEEQTAKESEQAVKQGRIAKYKSVVLSLEGNLNTYSTDFLPGYQRFVELAKKYEDILRWNYAPYTDANGVVKLSDGYLTSFFEKTDIEGAADNTIAFADYCRKNGIDFVYMQAPRKISKKQDKNISGTLDYSNQNADALIERLKQAGIDVYDFRDQIEAEELNHHELFYRTDHHWRAETGLWASRHILEYLSKQYGYSINASVLEQKNFKSVLYPSSFLGSNGRKVTLSVAEPEDFSLIYPTFQTDMHLSIPDADIELDGDFSIVYDMDRVAEVNYYENDPYAAYMYGNHALAQFENHMISNDSRLLVIHDSFGNCVLPFLSLGVKYIDSLDIRQFTGSIQSFIEKNKPNAVIILYNPSVINSSEDSHQGTFDFR